MEFTRKISQTGSLPSLKCCPTHVTVTSLAVLALLFSFPALPVLAALLSAVQHGAVLPP